MCVSLCWTKYTLAVVPSPIFLMILKSSIELWVVVLIVDLFKKEVLALLGLEISPVKEDFRELLLIKKLDFLTVPFLFV